MRVFSIIYKELKELIEEIRAEEEVWVKEVKGGVLEFKEFRSGKSAPNRRIGIGRNGILSILKDLTPEIE